MKIYEYRDYKSFLNDRLQALPKKGRGEYRKWALHLGVSTTLISQIFKGDKHLNLEMASDLADHIGLTQQETDYFFLLVELARAGSERLKQKLERRVKDSQTRAQKLSERLSQDMEMSEQQKMTFYSSWIYTGAWVSTARPDVQSAEDLARLLNQPRAVVQNVLQFLLESGLCVMKDGNLDVGPMRTHIGSDSPLVAKHHQNWRLRAMEKMATHEESRDLFYSAPMALNEEVAVRVRAELPAFIEKINKWVVPAPSEIVRCLNIDWFEY